MGEKKIAAEKAAAAKIEAARLAKIRAEKDKKAREADGFYEVCNTKSIELAKHVENESSTVVVHKRTVHVKKTHIVHRKTVTHTHKVHVTKKHVHRLTIHKTRGSCKGGKAHDMRM